MTMSSKMSFFIKVDLNQEEFFVPHVVLIYALYPSSVLVQMETLDCYSSFHVWKGKFS